MESDPARKPCPKEICILTREPCQVAMDAAGLPNLPTRSESPMSVSASLK